MRAKPLAVALLCAAPFLAGCGVRPQSQPVTTAAPADLVAGDRPVSERASRSRFEPLETAPTDPPAAEPATTTTIPPAATPQRRPAAPLRPAATAGASGGCGGWEALVASHFPAGEVPNACRRLMCESRGDPNARNRSGAAGLMQVMHGSTDPGANMAQAAALWRRSGWRPWVCR